MMPSDGPPRRAVSLLPTDAEEGEWRQGLGQSKTTSLCKSMCSRTCTHAGEAAHPPYLTATLELPGTSPGLQRNTSSGTPSRSPRSRMPDDPLRSIIDHSLSTLMAHHASHSVSCRVWVCRRNDCRQRMYCSGLRVGLAQTGNASPNGMPSTHWNWRIAT